MGGKNLPLPVPISCKHLRRLKTHPSHLAAFPFLCFQPCFSYLESCRIGCNFLQGLKFCVVGSEQLPLAAVARVTNILNSCINSLSCTIDF